MLEIPTASRWCMAHQPALGLDGFHSFGTLFSASRENQEHWAGLRKGRNKGRFTEDAGHPLTGLGGVGNRV